ncbi:hypothetical protein Tco_1502892 [Tanacetum coccineum]
MSFSKRSDTAQFPESFLCLIGISRYYELDDNVYPVFLVDDDEEMDLFAFINHADPSKVRIREREVREGEVPLLDSTVGHVVPLTGVNEQGNQNDDVEDDGNQNDDVQDARNNDEVPATVAEKAKGSRKKRKAAGGASGSSLPPKTLRADHGTSNAGASTGGKSIAALQGLLERITLLVEVGVTTVATLPFITSSGSLTSEREEGGRTDSVTGPNLRTQHPSERSLVSDPLIMTTVVATMAVADTSSVLVPRADMDSETLHQTYVPKWNVTNNSDLDDTDVCHSVVDHLAPPVLFSQLHSMDYDQLLVEFNVRAARQTCLSFEVRLWLEHNLRDKKKLEGKCSWQAGLLKEKDADIASLKAQLSLKEAEAAEAIHLRGQVAIVEAAEVARTNELNCLKERNSALEEEKSVLESKVVALESADATKLSVKASSLEAERDRLVSQVSLLEGTCFELHDEVSGYRLFKEQIDVVSDEQVKVIIGRRWILGHVLRLVVMKCLQSLEYLAALRGAIRRAIDKGMQDGLVISIDHGKAERAASQKDASIADIMGLFHLDGPLIELLSAENLVGEANTSGVSVVVAATTALSTTFVEASSIPPIPVSDYEVADTEAQAGTSFSHKIIFEEETLETSPENPAT